MKKIVALLHDGADIIFLSDVRLNTNHNKSGIHNLEKQFFNKGYTLKHNSKKNSRGVGILFNKNFNYTEVGTMCDNGDNYLLYKIKIENTEIILGAVYGPNNNDAEFFENLERDLAQFSNEGEINTILAGDWNLTWDVRENPNNINVINMANIPSKYRSLKLKKIANRLDLTDPYRYFNPTQKDLTYIPNARENINRSRIDFFVISEKLMNIVKKVDIENCTRTTAFDHKRVNLCFGKEKKRVNNQNIKNQIIHNPVVKLAVRATVFEVYIHHADSNSYPAYEKNSHLINIGRIMDWLKTYSANCIDNSANGLPTPDAGLLVEAENILETMPDIEYFEGLEKSCPDDVFFETLASSIKNTVLSEQQKIYKEKTCKKKNLMTRLLDLKKTMRGTTWKY
jgi:exonuclease III